MAEFDPVAAGQAALRAGEHQRAEAHFAQACDAEPTRLEAVLPLAELRLRRGASRAARTVLEAAVAAGARHSTCWSLLAAARRRTGAPAAARAAGEAALAEAPADPGARYQRGLAANAEGDWATALADSDALLAAGHDDPDLHDLAARAAEALGDMARAERGYRAVLRLRPDAVATGLALADRLHGAGRAGEALTVLDALAQPADRDPGWHARRGYALKALGEASAAQAALQEAVARRPHDMDALGALANVAWQRGEIAASDGHIAAAIAACEAAGTDLARRKRVEMLVFRATLQLVQARPGGAIATLENALAEAPRFERARNRLLQCLHYDPESPAVRRRDAYDQWRRRVAEPILAETTAPARRGGTPAPLTVGLLADKLRRAPPLWLFLAALENLDPSAVRLIVYDLGTEPTDDLTARLAGVAAAWHRIDGLSDAAAAQQMRTDGLDILVNKMSHAEGRPAILAHRPAPVQVQWGGIATTAVPAVDAFLGDPVATPPGCEADFVEPVYRLPEGYVAFTPPSDVAPPVAPLPARTAGHITFACFNESAKLNDRIFALWGRILGELPRARLLLKGKAFRDPAVDTRLRARMAEAGLPSERVDTEAPSRHGDLLARYNAVDIALDPWPYSGGLTTLEALWMGVPVLTLPDPSFTGRHAATHLAHTGLGDWIAADAEAYVAKAVAGARDWDALAALRAGLRQRVAASPLCDGPGQARNLETALRAIWRDSSAEAGPVAAGQAPRTTTDPESGVQTPGAEAARVAHEARAPAANERGEAATALVEREARLAAGHDNADLQRAIGQLAHKLGRRARAMAAYRAALAHRPGEATSAFALADLLHESGRERAALAVLDTVRPDPDNEAKWYARRGYALKNLGELDAARACLAAALERRARDPDAWGSLARIAWLQGDVAGSESAIRQALAATEGARTPALVEKHLAMRLFLATLLTVKARVGEALAAYRGVLGARPNWMKAHDRFLQALLYDPETEPATRRAEYRAWQQRHADPILAQSSAPVPRPVDTEALTVGILGGNFRRGPPLWLFLAAFENLDPRRYRLIVYSHGIDAPDDLTQRLRACSWAWRDITGLSDAQAAQRLRADGLDILINKMGHAEGRLRIPAYRPAPVQLQWGGVATSAVPAMDGFLGDWVASPPGCESDFVERIHRLPEGYVAFTPPEDTAPPVGPLPARQAGAITFGCFNIAAKLNAELFALWGRILAELPDAQLVLKGSQVFADPASVAELRTQMDRAGLDSSRVAFAGRSSHGDLLASYRAVDIALDPWPYSGGLTTLEALWMGVPVVTLPDATFTGRHAATHLAHTGLSDWIAADSEAYVAKAVAWAGDWDALAALRGELRARVAASPLCDGPRQAGHLAEALETFWQAKAAGPVGGD